MAKIITESFRVENSNELFNSFKNTNPTLSSNFLSLLGAYSTTNSLNLTTGNKLAIQDFVDAQLEALRPESNYYIVASSIDKPTQIDNSQKEKREFLRRAIFGNKITDSDVRYMFYKNNWVADTVYDAFDDQQDVTAANSIVTVPDIEGNYTVYKCLVNNNGGKSTVTPSKTGIDASSYETILTADNYQWKYMFTVSSSDVEIYQTTDSLPLPYPAYGDIGVIASAKESMSQIIIERTPVSQFTAYRFGPSTNSGNASDVVVRSATQSGTIKTLVIATTIKVGFTLYSSDDAYKNMYLKTANAVYDILSSTYEDTDYEDTDKIRITISTTDSIPISSICQVVPKINVSRSTPTGQPCKAYGVIDQYGTLIRIGFTSKGTEYKFATAEVVYPKSLTSPEPTVLRCVVSPTGGHGSNPISEMSMSRLAIITNFSGDTNTIPNSNAYTKVGLVKNPVFSDGVYLPVFDNRTIIKLSGDQSGIAPGLAPNPANTKYYIRQYINTATGVVRSAPVVGQELGVNDEVILATVHQVSYAADVDLTLVYLVDYYGNFQSKFKTGKVYLASSQQTTATELTINNDTDIVYGKYTPYTGELLHYVDFDPITRQSGRKEKIKFIFDF
jgi:hypothetical protein